MVCLAEILAGAAGRLRLDPRSVQAHQSQSNSSEHDREVAPVDQYVSRLFRFWVRESLFSH